MSKAIAGVIDDLCHVLGLNKKLITRITLMPDKVVVDLYDAKLGIIITKTTPVALHRVAEQ